MTLMPADTCLLIPARYRRSSPALSPENQHNAYIVLTNFIQNRGIVFSGLTNKAVSDFSLAGFPPGKGNQSEGGECV